MITDAEAKTMLRECMTRDSYLIDYMSQPHVMLMVKDPQKDIVLWVNHVVCERVGQPLEKIAGTHSSKYWPELFEEFHSDDVEVMKSGVDRIRFPESFSLDNTAPILLTSKFNIQWQGRPALMIIAIDGEAFIRGIGQRAGQGDVGRAYRPGSATTLLHNFESARALLAQVVRRHDR